MEPSFWRGSNRVMAFGSENKGKTILLPLLLSVSMLCMITSYGILRAQGNEKDSTPALVAFLDKTSVRVGESVWLTLKFSLSDGARLPERPEIKGIEGLIITGRVKENDHIRIRLLVDQLGSWRSGQISLTYFDKEGNEKTVSTDPVSLTVLSNLGGKPEEARLRPIQDIVSTVPKWFEYLPWAVAVMGLLFIIAALIWWSMRRRAKDISEELVEPAHIRAKREIDQLETQGLFEKGKVKAFYFTLSEIMTRYMETIRHFPAAEYTTEEIAHHIRNNEEDRKILPLLRQADLVKFADTVPTSARKDEHIQMAHAYIQETGLVLESINRGLEIQEDVR